MPLSLFERPGDGIEASARLAFSGNRVERLSEHRPADCLERALADERARAWLVAGGRVVLRKNSGIHALFGLPALEGLAIDGENAILLGYDGDGAPLLAIAVDAPPDALPEGLTAVAPRALFVDGLMQGAILGEAAQAVAMTNWARNSLYCGRCGRMTAPQAGGYRRVCSGEEGCGNTIFPRTDPVVIMLAVDEAKDRCLLGRSHHFPAGFYSCLAGFLEPGETMEEAVRRETHEEAGISIGRVRYHASQPWPAPHSIMTGFYAEALSETIEMDRAELEDCRWFTRAEAARLIERRPGELTTAPDGTIANRLLRDWVG